VFLLGQRLPVEVVAVAEVVPSGGTAREEVVCIWRLSSWQQQKVKKRLGTAAVNLAICRSCLQFYLASSARAATLSGLTDVIG
jgi:hypothetical protein